MRKLIITIALAATTVASTGCFTATGVALGRANKTTEVVRMPDGTRITSESDDVVVGLVVGAALDVLTLYAISSMSPSCSFTYGAGEGGGGC